MRYVIFEEAFYRRLTMTGPGGVSQSSSASRSNSVQNNSATNQSRNPAADIVRSATDPRTGRVDTAALGKMVADAAKVDFRAANAAYNQIERQLSVGDASRFAQDVRAASAANNNAPNSTTAAGTALYVVGSQANALGRTQIARGAAQAAQGADILRNNPILSIRWETTTSQWTQRGGLSGPLADRLRAGGIEVSSSNYAPPAGSVGRSSGFSSGVAANMNGGLAENMIANNYRAQGFNVTQGANMYVGASNPNNIVQNGSRIVDVVAERPNADFRQNTRIEVESKVGYTPNSGRAAQEATADIARLADNRTARATGEALETVGNGLTRSGGALRTFGRVARPVGIALDVIDVGSSFRADGNRIGQNTGRSLSGIAGGAGGAWAGAAAGAAIGSVVPVVGTVIGGIIGGAIGAFAGDAAGKGLFNTISSWF
jgi:hypothetical protein